jgi:hypothetical protein
MKHFLVSKPIHYDPPSSYHYVFIATHQRHAYAHQSQQDTSTYPNAHGSNRTTLQLSKSCSTSEIVLVLNRNALGLERISAIQLQNIEDE